MVNVVLGKMSVEEAEGIVDLLGQGGMLSIEEGVIDATNEEGQEKLRQIEKQNKENVEGRVEGIDDAVERDETPEMQLKNSVDELD
jgi:cell division cycle protein 37